MSQVTPFLWFDTEAEEAARFYTGLFADGAVLHVDHYGSAGPREAGLVRTVTFTVAGQEVLALNGGPGNPFTEAVSLMVTCQDQDEVDRLWKALADGGEPGPCGWLKDRYGLSWQIVPELLMDLLKDGDPVKSEAVMAEMLQMGKIESARLQAVFDRA